MKIIFFGTPNYVLPILTALHKKFVTGPGVSPIAAVVTQSPKPFGRKQILTYTPIDKWAHEHKLPIYYSAEDLLKASPIAEMGVLASYGQIIKNEVINLFPKGILVVHPSLLPKYRGASPVPEAIKNGDQKSGVTIFKMDDKVDHGPIVVQSKEEILPGDTGESLRGRLFAKSADILVETIGPYTQGKIKPKAQDDSEATFTKLVTRQDGFIDLKDKSPEEAERFIRAMYPWPGAWTLLRSEGATEGQAKQLKILKAHVEGGKLILDEVQLEGKTAVTGKQFDEAYPQFSHLF